MVNMNSAAVVADSLKGFGGFLRCETCGHEMPLGGVECKVRSGWPKHCGYTMRWWTQRQIDAGEVPQVASRSGE